MTIMYYDPLAASQGKRVHQIVKSIASGERITTYRSIAALSHGLRRPTNGHQIAILFASSDEALSQLRGLSDLIRNLRIILILPDDERATMSSGSKLFPRFVSYMDSDFSDVGAVLEKMLENSGNTHQQQDGDSS